MLAAFDLLMRPMGVVGSIPYIFYSVEHRFSWNAESQVPTQGLALGVSLTGS